MTHLDALELRLSHERMFLQIAKTDQERKLRIVWISQIEKEIAAEKTFVGSNDMTDDEILAELMR